MPSILINFVFLFGFAAIGLTAGWWLRGNLKKLFGSAREESLVATEEELESKRQETEKAIYRVQKLTQNIAYDVEEHSEHVQEANDNLRMIDEDNTEDMLATLAKIIYANERLQSQLDKAEEKLNAQAVLMACQAEEARTDALTSVANRRAFDAELAEAENAFRHDGQDSCVMMMDVDHFKKFNDTHGHQAGDEVLKHVAKSIRRKVKRDGLVARYGGEEFAVIFRNMGLEQCLEKAERARASISQIHIDFEGKDLQVNASAGLAGMLQGELGTNLVKRSDDALYKAKNEGRNRGYYHDGDECFPLINYESAAAAGDEDKVAKALMESVQKSGSELQAASCPQQQEAKTAIVPSDSNNGSQTETESEINMPHEATLDTSSTNENAVEPVQSVAKTQPEKSDWKSQISGRMEFCEDLTRRIAEWKRGGRSLSILLLHVDELTQIVASRGEAGLDVVLKTTAQFLKASMRDMDHVARFDDGTFALMLPSSEVQNAAAVAERLRMAISRCQVPLPEGTLRFTVSIGICELRTGDTVGSLLARTQTSLNMAISDGGNNCRFESQQPV